MHMHKKFEINQTKIEGGCQSGRNAVTHNSKSDLPLETDAFPPSFPPFAFLLKAGLLTNLIDLLLKAGSGW